MKRTLSFGLLLVTAACGADEPGRLAQSEVPLNVMISPAVEAPGLESFPGLLRSERSAEVATRIAGTVDAVHVDVGQTVRKGSPLVTLSGEDIDARISGAGAAFQLAERTHRRIANLASDGAASAQELDQAIASLAAARAALGEAEAQSAYAVVSAPFDGVVTSRSVDPGDLATPGSPLVTLVAPGSLKVVVDLPADRYGAVSPGDRVSIEVGGASATVDAEVTRTVPALERGSRTFRLEAVLDAPVAGGIPGAFARLHLPAPRGGTVWVPQDAIVERGQLRGVAVVEKDVLRLRWVRLGQRRGDAVELLAGPPAPFAVVRRPPTGIHDRARLGSLQTEAWAGPHDVPARSVSSPDPTVGPEVER